MRSLRFGFAFATTLLAATGASAAVISDPAGDFVQGYIGPSAADLDVTQISVTLLNAATFEISATLAGAVGTTPGGFYVWGVNKGAGGAEFGPDFAGVLFDAVVVLQQTGTGVVINFDGTAPTPLAAGAVTISGSTITADVPVADLPSTGFLASHYGWNLWPRSGSGGNGVEFVSDFAPDNGTLAVDGTLAAVPAPASTGIVLLGLATLAILRRHPSRNQ